ncbi:LysR substrate-binding domain-containing protein [Hyphomonas johnsonii]|uniref:LysR family transcriptional regulator n=1 Tax=Hyphomonas johnsonii MHS-2 TaxID=1280950 RepID=A0A059FQD4_9PROT|nr:LysR substrate-binding domain-containing protein [Hyphomonas johnsonii]KCZ92827.1 LysR family transcriptional regulator [Hyphomonas johnsonii MHS-2]
MRPTLRQLQYLVAIADTGKFGDAAKRVNVSQPSLSAQVAEMETELGATLIERGRHGALLTPIGVELVRRARLILQDMEDFKTVARRDTDGLSGRMRVGVLPTIGPYLLPNATRQLHGRFPDLRFNVREERTIDLYGHLNEGMFDFIISVPDAHEGMATATLFEENLWICTASDNPLAHPRGPVKLADLKGRTLLSLGHWHRLNLMIQSIARDAKAHVSAEYDGSSLDSARQMAEMGAGVAVLPSLYALTERRRDPGLMIRRIDHPSARRKIALIWRPTSNIADRMTILTDVFRDAAEDILSLETEQDRVSVK